MSEIGIRLKTIRKIKNISQQELELAIDASCGHISRIESGEINPTKETLIKISEVLKLNPKETNLFLNFHSQKVTPQEIEDAAVYIQPYLLRSRNPAYLVDDMWFVYAWNQAMLDLFGLNRKESNHLIGIHELVFIFHPNLLLRKNLPENEWKEIASSQLNHFIADLNVSLRLNEKWLKDLLKELESLPDFKNLWNKAILSYRNHLPENERYLNITVQGKKLTYFISALNIDKYPRFNLIELILKDE